MSDYIQHHGIKGMHWGVRRTPEQLGNGKNGSQPRKKIEEVHEDYANAHNAKSIKQMSNKELQDRIARIDLERKYNQMEHSSIDRGEKFMQKASSILNSAASVSNSILTMSKNAKALYSLYQDHNSSKSSNGVEDNVQSKNKANVLRRIASDAPRTAMNLSRKAQEAYSRHKYNPWKHK